MPLFFQIGKKNIKGLLNVVYLASCCEFAEISGYPGCKVRIPEYLKPTCGAALGRVQAVSKLFFFLPPRAS